MYARSAAIMPLSCFWFGAPALSEYMMISLTRNIAAALPIKPISNVFSRIWGMSEIIETGIAMTIFRSRLFTFLYPLIFFLF